MDSMILKVFSSLNDSVILKQLGFSQDTSPSVYKRAVSFFGVSVSVPVGVKLPWQDSGKLSGTVQEGFLPGRDGQALELPRAVEFPSLEVSREGVDVTLSALGNDKVGMDHKLGSVVWEGFSTLRDSGISCWAA